MERNTRSKSEREYVKTLIHNLSLQRLTDHEIVDYLHQKEIEIARTTVNRIRNTIECSAAKWYIDLRSSTTKYIAAHKERIDSLLSYQKKLHEIIAATKREEIKIRAISELHSIEKTIFDMWKQLPTLDIQSDQPKQQEQTEDQERRPTMVDDDDIYGTEVEPWDMPSWCQCDGCKRWWRRKELLDYHQKKGTCTSTNGVVPAITVPAAAAEKTVSQRPADSDSDLNKIDKDGEWQQLQCPTCNKWFMNNFTLSAHKCTTTTVS